MKVLTFISYYLPGFKGGGPIRTLANMVEQMGNELEFRIVTSDRDLGDSAPYEGYAPGRWVPVGNGQVLYLPPRAQSLSGIARLMTTEEYDVLYLHSFFTPSFTIKPLLIRRLGLGRTSPVIVAPRGEFSPGALAIKRVKKVAFITLARVLGLYRGVVWQASSREEAADIRRWFSDGTILVAPNLRTALPPAPRGRKQKGRLRVIFLSRISPKKNLLLALRALSSVNGLIDFSIYGPVDDQEYWEDCERLIKTLPANIRVSYEGPVSHDQVSQKMAEHDLFFLPTAGENFGHAILEAFLAGTPVLISDQTPWRDLPKTGAGWDLPLEPLDKFCDVLQRMVGSDEADFEAFSIAAAAYGLSVCRDETALNQNLELFHCVERQPTERVPA